MSDTVKLLAERQKTHGEYIDHARATQNIMRAMKGERNYDGLPDTMRESLHMFAHKIGRIVTGNPFLKDHWDDIAGYATLISLRINAAQDAIEVPKNDPLTALKDASEKLHGMTDERPEGPVARQVTVNLNVTGGEEAGIKIREAISGRTRNLSEYAGSAADGGHHHPKMLDHRNFRVQYIGAIGHFKGRDGDCIGTVTSIDPTSGNAIIRYKVRWDRATYDGDYHPYDLVFTTEVRVLKYSGNDVPDIVKAC